MPRKIPNKVLVQARVKPATRKELERRARKAGTRFCTYIAELLERTVRCCDNGNFGRRARVPKARRRMKKK